MINKPTKTQLSKIPKLRSQENESDPKVYMKFFLANMTWYPIEYDKKSQQFFGWVINDNMPQGAELGYFSLRELKAINVRGMEVDREIHGITPYAPKRLSQVKRMHNINHGVSQEGQNEYYRDSNNKIDDTRVSPYGDRMLNSIQGQTLHFSDGNVVVRGEKLVFEKTGKVFSEIKSDRAINKIMFKLM